MRILTSFISLIVSCVVSVAQTTSPTPYIIGGTAPAGVKSLLLSTVQNEPVDTVTVVDGKFSFRGELPMHTFLCVSDNNGFFLPVNMIVDGEPVDIDIESQTLKGSKLNERLNKTDRQIMDLEIQYMQDQAEFSRVEPWRMAKRDSLRRQMTFTYNKLIVSMKNAIRANSDNVIPALYLSQIYNTMDYAELKELLSSGAPYATHPLCNGAWRTINHKEKSDIGQMFTDVAESDTTGVVHHLSEYVGKGNYVLVDFWASWCAPCLSEMPNLKANYAKYHEKGFEIVGLSFDRSKSSWMKAISSHKLTWIHLSDLKYWNSEASVVYGISSIPASLLLDGDGRIVATNLRGEELGRKLSEIYGF